MTRALSAVLSAALLATPLGGCQTLLALKPAPTVELQATQALYVAEAAFAGASMALEQAVDGGALKGGSAVTARQIYAQAHDALMAARQARAVGDYARELASASAATSASGQVQSLSTSGAGS
jgi:hypothetical protein